MASIAFWNIRGLNDPIKQNGVNEFILKNKVKLIGLLETKVGRDNICEVKNRINPHLDYDENLDQAPYGRIIIMWNPQECKVTTIRKTEKSIHLQVKFLIDNNVIFLTMVYANNQMNARDPFWSEIATIASTTTGPWAIAGDMNCIANCSEKVGGAQVTNRDTEELKNCMQQ